MNTDEQTFQELKKRLETEALRFLRGKPYLRDNGDGTFSQEIYADYRDVMDDKTAAEIRRRNLRIGRPVAGVRGEDVGMVRQLRV